MWMWIYVMGVRDILKENDSQVLDLNQWVDGGAIH